MKTQTRKIAAAWVLLSLAIAAAIGGTSANSNGVQSLDTSADLATTIAKLNELINVLRR